MYISTLLKSFHDLISALQGYVDDTYELSEGNKQLSNLFWKWKLTSDIALASRVGESCLVSFSYLANKESMSLPGNTVNIKVTVLTSALFFCWSNLDGYVGCGLWAGIFWQMVC